MDIIFVCMMGGVVIIIIDPFSKYLMVGSLFVELLTLGILNNIPANAGFIAHDHLE